MNDGQLVLHGGEGHPSGPRTFTRTLGRAPIGEWTQLRVLVRFSADPDKAGVSVWRDGRSVVVDDHPRAGTLYPGQQSYLKVGLHRDRTIAPPSTVRISAWRIDHGHAPADPDRAGPSPDNTPTAASRSTRPPDGERRSTRSGTSDQRASERSARVESDRDVAPKTRTIHRGTSSDSTSRREESEDSSTSEHRPEPSRRTSPHHASPRGASEDASSHRGSSREGASADSDAGGSDDSGEHSSEG